MSSATIYHVSEQAGIKRFEPRIGRDGRAWVWAIADSHLVNYLLPRDCPRVTFHRRADTLSEEAERYLAGADHVVAIEEVWLEIASSTRLALYEMPAELFHRHDETAGYYISPKSVEPRRELQIDRPLEEIRARGAELRVLPCLWQLREEIASSTLGFSVIRFRNASPPPAGFVSRFPVPDG